MFIRCNFCRSLLCHQLFGEPGCEGRFAPLTEYQQGFEAGELFWRESFVELRSHLRQMLNEKDVRSNSAVDDQWIIDELRRLLGIADSPHRFLNFPRPHNRFVDE